MEVYTVGISLLSVRELYRELYYIGKSKELHIQMTDSRGVFKEGMSV